MTMRVPKATFDFCCRTIPRLVTLLLLLVAHAPAAVPALAVLMPPLALMAVFYWAVHRPDWLGAGSAFLFGLLADLLWGAPLGVSAGLYAVAHMLLVQQQRFFKGTHFTLLWAGYGLTQFFVTGGQVLLWFLLTRTPFDGGNFLLMNLYGLLLFPLVCFGLSRLHHSLTKVLHA